MAATICELRWLSYILKNFDNKAALHIVVNPIFHEWTKHIKLDCYLVGDACKEGFVVPSHIRCSNQLSDMFTKVFSLKVFGSMLSKLGLVSLVLNPLVGLSNFILLLLQPYPPTQLYDAGV
ncbi:UNVERIFIED_CONTAM: hypothetical protein Sradi_3868100 [Sesamum radiatum]|uniref:Uncharacterized protein n=1 Tax=Sesamum radiatum TaxID=300843 RepID=A0AAW2Q295_SESRA